MFGYLRILSIMSLAAVAAAFVVAGMSFRDLATGNLVMLAERDNVTRAEGYMYSVWQQYRGIVMNLSVGDPELIKNDAQVAQFAQDTVRYFRHMPVLRVNLYNHQGLLLLSTDPNAQYKLVDASSPNMSMVFTRLRKPGAASVVLPDMEMKDRTHQAVHKGTVVQTLVSLQPDAKREIEGLLEIVYDISEPWARQAQLQLYGAAGALVLFLTFLGILFFTSRKAEFIIARQHEANLELAAAAEAAQAQNRDKSQFLANVSHELRTPLNAIIGFSEILKAEVIAALENKKYHDYISDIHSSGVHLLSLINDILEYSKAEAGKLELEVTEVNASKLVQNSMRLVSPRAESSKVKLVEAMPKEQFILMTDSKKFRQVLLNLLSNAVKFTPAGGEVRVSAWRDLADDTYTFEVRDTGIGIAPKDISRAMAPFGQVDSTLSRKYEGTGLGLPLTKKFVEIMGGKFSIESQVNKGTTVTFTLPRDAREDGAGALSAV